MDDNNRNYYVIRCFGGKEGLINYITEHSVVAFGWRDLHFVDMSPDEVHKKTYELWGGRGAGSVGAQARKFREIKAGDRIIVPISGAFLLAEAIGECIYDKEAVSRNIANQQRVTYLKNDSGEVLRIPRHSVSGTLQRKLGLLPTLIRADACAREIDALWENKDWNTLFNEAQEKRIAENKKRLLKKIQEGNTKLRGGGAGLEHLVRELMEIEGYESVQLSKRTFPGNTADADVEGKRTNMLSGEEIVVVQVKHHRGYTGEWGVQQLKAIQASEDYKSEDTHFVLLSSADGFTPDTQEMAEGAIKLIDGNQLVDWVISRANDLEPDTRRALGISNYPMLLDI